MPLIRASSRYYCWVIVFAGMLGLCACLGLGRFSLGMMLPGMGEGLSLSYSEMGFISTMNFCGYLGAVLVCGRFSAVLGPRLLIFLGLLLVGSSMVLIGFSSSLSVIIILYFCTGIGSALSNVPIMTLISTWFEPNLRGRAAGLCVMGNGIGILLSGRIVPLVSETDWRPTWLVLGGMVVVIALICLTLLRNEPVQSVSSKKQAKRTAQEKERMVDDAGNGKRLFHCAALYFLFGFTYVIYITFFVTLLVEERNLTEQFAGNLWSLVGIISLGSGPLFGYFSDKAGRKIALMVVYSLQTAAYLLVAMKLPPVSLYISIVFYGMVAFSVPTIMAALIGDYFGPERMAAMFGFITFAFGIGQIAGPAIAGIVAEKTGSFSMSFFMAALLTFFAVVLSSRLSHRRK